MNTYFACVFAMGYLVFFGIMINSTCIHSIKEVTTNESVNSIVLFFILFKQMIKIFTRINKK